MKRNILPILVLFTAGLNCHPKSSACLRAKVIRISCASFVVQVLNKDSVGSYGWRDIGGHGIYNNVFRVSNPCNIGPWARGEEFSFTINDSLKQKECATCRMYDAPPEKSYLITNVSAAPCK